LGIENWSLVIAPPEGIADSRNDGFFTQALCPSEGGIIARSLVNQGSWEGRSPR